MINSINPDTIFSKANHFWWVIIAGLESFSQRLLRGLVRRRAEQIRALPADVRKEKVLAIRQQIEEGTYDIDGKFGEVIDRLLEEDLLH